jgi:methylenetetrahydrofolate reductase (NADPH)
MTDPNNGALRSLLERSYLEVIPVKSVENQLIHVPVNSWLGISCSPTAGVEPTLGLVERVNSQHGDRGLKLVPHIAARVIRDRRHLADVVARLEEAGVRSIFVPGGDSKEPAGQYDSALGLLRDMAELGHRFVNVGVAAHPEGHPLVAEEELFCILLEKQQYATYLVTQMCFDPEVIIGWLRRIRRAGIFLHVWPGVPGVMEIPKLLALSLRIGVGQSTRMLNRQKSLAKKLLVRRSYRADALLDGLRPALADPALGVSGFHLYSFNNVQATERWRDEIRGKTGNREGFSP